MNNAFVDRNGVTWIKAVPVIDRLYKISEELDFGWSLVTDYINELEDDVIKSLYPDAPMNNKP